MQHSECISHIVETATIRKSLHETNLSFTVDVWETPNKPGSERSPEHSTHS